MSAPPSLSYADWQALGLSKRQKWAYVDNYQGHGPAVVGWQQAPGGTGGITEPGVRWWVATTEWAPGGLPWPPFWSLELFREVIERRSGRIMGDLDGVRRRAPKIAANPKIRQVGADVGRQEPMPCVCAHPDCKQRGRVQSMYPGNARYGKGLSCCFGRGQTAEQRARGSRTIARRHGVRHIAEIAVEVPWLVPLFGPDDYVNNGTHLPYRCLRCGGVHQIQPQHAIRGKAKCGSAWAQPMANGRDPAEVGQKGHAALGPEGLRAAGRRGAAAQPVEAKRAGGLASGCPIDNPRDVLRGLYHASEQVPTWVYLWATPVPGVRVFGLTNCEDARPSHGAWYEGSAPLAKVQCRRRSDAVLVEAFFKHPDWQLPTPAELVGQVGATELTDADPATWEERARELVAQVEALGHQAYAEEHLPWL